MADDKIVEGIIESLQEAIAWKRRELDLEVVKVDPTLADSSKVIEQSPEAVEKAAHTA